MKYLDYREKLQQGTFDFPIAYYEVTSSHPRYHMMPHWHPEYELIRIQQGTLLLSLDGKSFTCHAGDVVFVTDGVLHSGTPDECHYECIVFDMKLLLKDNHICKKTIEKIIHHQTTIDTLLPHEDPALETILASLFDAMKNREPGYEFVTQGTLYQFLGYILKKQLFHKALPSSIDSSHALARFKKILQYIENHYQEPVTLDHLAEVANMNPKYFCRFFKEMTMRTPIDYLNYYRVECACEQLLTEHQTVTDTALNCGFGDTSYFIKTFRKYKNITPKQYLKQNRSPD